MYKLLPILLFAYGIASSDNYDNIIQSEVDLRTEDIEKDINSILDTNKYRIGVECDIRDTILITNLIKRDGSVFFFEHETEETIEIENYLKQGGYYNIIDDNYFYYPIKGSFAILEITFNFQPYINKKLENSKELDAAVIAIVRLSYLAYLNDTNTEKVYSAKLLKETYKEHKDEENAKSHVSFYSIESTKKTK